MVEGRGAGREGRGGEVGHFYLGGGDKVGESERKRRKRESD